MWLSHSSSSLHSLVVHTVLEANFASNSLEEEPSAGTVDAVFATSLSFEIC